jgi:arylsulfatase A-like enzyme
LESRIQNLISKIISKSIIYGFFFLAGLNLFAQSDVEKPNIVWLVTEDNSKHFLRLYETGGTVMPHIETLAENGIVFNHAFSNAPVCSVARSTLISGCYAPRLGAQYHRRMKLIPLPEGMEMFPYYLRKAGYYTTNNNKEDYNFIKPEQVWDESSKKATYKNRNPGQPFFHVQNYATTHEGKLHFSQNKMDNTPMVTSMEGIVPFPYHPNTPTFRYTYAVYHNLHQKVDQEIGELLQQLEYDGLMDNTIIFYFGDHGGVLPRSKGYIYESGTHVPLVVYIPEKWKHLVPKSIGSRTDVFVQFIDFAPTVLNLAGVKTPSQMDGKAFLGKGVSPAALEERNFTFSYADRFDEKYDMVRAIRKGKFKYIRNYQPFNIDALFNFYRYKMLAFKEWRDLFQMGTLNEVQKLFFQPRQVEALYDLEVDPHEVANLAQNPFYKKTLEELRLLCQLQVKSMPDLSFYPEPYFLQEGLANPVRFGQQHKSDIAELIDISDLSLLPYSMARLDIRKALNSKNPWKRYWGLIVCSTFASQAANFYPKAIRIAQKDKENLVRMRAVEFLELNDQTVDTKMILDIVKSAKSESEANLILNTVALLKTVKPDFQLKLSKKMFHPDWTAKESDLVSRRIEFINN